MRFIFLLTALIPYSATSLISQTEFDQPWMDTSKAIIIDLYSENEVDWTEMKKDKQLVAIIHKASQGTNYDKKYAERRNIALKNGYKWGSYHLGTAGDPIAQADYYLNIVGNDPKELLALDLESNDTAYHMSPYNAVKFIQRIYQKTKRYPVVYCNRYMLTLIQHTNQSINTWSNCNLWYARFRKDIPDYNPILWPTYTLWQFSSEINCKTTGGCLYNVPGTLYDMDINVYNGTKKQLLENWPLNKVVN